MDKSSFRQNPYFLIIPESHRKSNYEKGGFSPPPQIAHKKGRTPQRPLFHVVF